MMDSDAKAKILIVFLEKSHGVLIVDHHFQVGFNGRQDQLSIVGYLRGGVTLDGNDIRMW